MTRRIELALAAAALAASLLYAPAAEAQARSRAASGGSLLGAETLAPGRDMLSARFGWPDLTLEYTHGMSPGFDLGGRFQFVYGVESTTTSKFGIAFAVPMRWSLSRAGNVRLAFHVDPGLRLYTYDPALFGFQFPFGLNLEIPVSPPILFGVGADFNATLMITGGASPQFFFGPLVGPWMEYRIDPRLSFGLDSRFGAIIDAYSGEGRYGGGTESRFGFRVQMTLAYKL